MADIELVVTQKDPHRVDTYNGLGAMFAVQPNPESFPVLVMRGGTEENHVLMLACIMHYMKLLHPRTYHRATELVDSGKLPQPAEVGPQQELKH